MVLALWRGNKLSHLRKAWPPTSPPLVALATGPLPPQRNQGFHRVHTLHSGGGGGLGRDSWTSPAQGHSPETSSVHLAHPVHGVGNRTGRLQNRGVCSVCRSFR